MKDMYSEIGAVLALAPAVQGDAATGSAIDLQQYRSIVFAMSTGAIAGAGDFGVKVQHSDTTTSGDFVDAPSGTFVSNAPETLTANSCFKISYNGPKRFVRLAVTKEGGTSIALGAVAILGHPAVAPVA